MLDAGCVVLGAGPDSQADDYRGVMQFETWLASDGSYEAGTCCAARALDQAARRMIIEAESMMQRPRDLASIQGHFITRIWY